MKKKSSVETATIKKKSLKSKKEKPDIYKDYDHNTLVIKEKDPLYGSKLGIKYLRICTCKPTHINCLTASQWIKHQLGVWEFYYEKRDIRDKTLHPATFPLSLSKKIIELFSHQGELVIDPFVGSGTTLLAAQDTNRNAIGFDLQKNYIDLTFSRLNHDNFFNSAKQIAVQDDARNIKNYLENESVSLIWTSPPYGNLLNRARKNKSRRDRNNEQLGKVEQYSQDERDLGTYELDKFTEVMGNIFEGLLPLLKEKAHCVINIPDMWWENKRMTTNVLIN